MSAVITPEVTAGVFDMTAEDYFADPVPGGSLSSSGARQLLDCPAKFRWQQDNPRTPSRAFDLGHAVHTVVLGNGSEIVVIPAENYNTKAAQQAKKDAHAAGKTPLLPDEHARVQAMAAAIRNDRLAGALLAPERGVSEATLIAQDPATKVWVRARPDKLPFQGKQRMIIPDLKSCLSVHPEALSKAIWDHGYYVQAPWYLTTAQWLNLCGDDAAFLFVFVEKTPPHLIAVVELDELAMRVGRMRMANALTRYATCKAGDNWPGYDEEGDGIQRIGLPPYIARRYEKENWL